MKQTGFSKFQDLTTEVCCVSTSTKERKEDGAEKVFLSTRKHINIPKRVINLDDFQKDVLHRTFLNVVAKANSLLSKK
jgi:hypothetical protein